MAFVTVGDVELFATDTGEGSPMLLVHGWACDSHDWSWQLEAFAARHRVIAPDLRGHGRSSVPAGGYLPRTFAADLGGLLEQLGTGPVVAVGHSLGAVIVSVLAVERPDLVRAVVAVDPAYAVSASIRDRILANAVTFREAGGHEAAAAIHRGMDAPASLPHLVAWHGRRVLGTPHRVVADTYAGLYEPDDQVGLDPASSEYLRRRACPVLAVYASPKRAEHEHTLHAHPDSRTEAWPGTGHWLHQERADGFNQLVLDWVDGLG